MTHDNFGIQVDTFLVSDPIKPYHIKDSILSDKEVQRLKKKIDRNTKIKKSSKYLFLNNKE